MKPDDAARDLEQYLHTLRPLSLRWHLIAHAIALLRTDSAPMLAWWRGWECGELRQVRQWCERLPYASVDEQDEGEIATWCDWFSEQLAGVSVEAQQRFRRAYLCQWEPLFGDARDAARTGVIEKAEALAAEREAQPAEGGAA